MRVALFIPCYIDQLYPDVGLASLELLEQLGCDVWLPETVSCCGQPLINSGAVAAAAPLAQRFETIFSECEVLVCPSGSCVATLRANVERYGLTADPGRIFELTQFLEGRLDPGKLDLYFPHKVALHQSCHGLRELGLGQMSEVVVPSGRARKNPARELLSRIRGLTLVEPERPDECCGFGGSFCVAESAVSSAMGQSRIADFVGAGAEVVTSGDMSCLMHLSGLIQRQHEPLSVMHIAQILAGRQPAS